MPVNPDDHAADESDPRHIYNVRAQHAADTAERDMLRAIEREVDPQPRTTPVGIALRAARSIAGNSIDKS